MKTRNYFLALVAALVLSAVPVIAQNSGATTGASSAPAKSSATPAKTSTTAPASSSKSSAGKSSASSASKLDVNAATADQLKTLPGIGDVTAQKIIAGRPYRAKNDLVSKKIISQSEYDSIKDQIIAHRAAGSSAATGKTPSTK